MLNNIFRLGWKKKNADIIYNMLMSLVSLYQRNVKKYKKLMKRVIDGKNLHIFWTTWGISVKYLGKMWLMIILKVTKNRASPSLYKIHFWKNHRGVELNQSWITVRGYKQILTSLTGTLRKISSFHLTSKISNFYFLAWPKQIHLL